MGAIYRRELMAYFTTPIGYVFSAIFFAISGFMFVFFTFNSGTTDVTMYFSVMIVFFIVLIPLLTMKLFSEEKKMGTELVLMTSPVSLVGVVCAKFFAAFTLFAGTLGVSLTLNMISLYKVASKQQVYRVIEKTSSMETFWGCVLGILLAGAALIAIGVFISSLTESQMVAGIASIGVFALLIISSIFVNTLEVEWMRNILKAILILDRFKNFQRGIFDVTTVVYLLSVVTVFLFLTVRVYEKRRWS